MRALALAALAGLVGAETCDSGNGGQPSAEPERVATRGADPGGFLPSVCMGQDDVRTWRRAEPGAVPIDRESRRAWRGSQCDWSVVVHEGAPIVFAQRPPTLPPTFSPGDTSGPPSAVQTGGPGVLLGFDGGEWGGSLSWHTAGGTLQRRLLSSNVVDIVAAFGGFLVLTYEGHGSRPRVVEVRDVAGRFEVGRTAELPGVPSGAAVEREGTVLVATGKGLLRISGDLLVRPVLEANWWMMNPVSLAIGDQGIVYVGMRGLVVELQMSSQRPTQTWLYPF
jgi:hypothetical protein